jgi:hypothetical protein
LEDAGNQCYRRRRGGEGGAGEARREGREATNVVAAGEAERKVLAARQKGKGRNNGEAERTGGKEGIEGDGDWEAAGWEWSVDSGREKPRPLATYLRTRGPQRDQQVPSDRWLTIKLEACSNYLAECTVLIISFGVYCALHVHSCRGHGIVLATRVIVIHNMKSLIKVVVYTK